MLTRPALIALAFASSAAGQFAYDFNGLKGNDTHPYTLLDQQDGWSEQTVGARNRCGVTATLSHDGTQSLRFQEVGPGFGCDASRINDASWAYAKFTGTETSAYFQADIQVGHWGGAFSLGYDKSSDGKIRGAQAGERGVQFIVGTHANVQFQLVAANGKSVRVPLSSIGGVSGGHWLRVRVMMDLTGAAGAGLGWVDVANLTTKAANIPVPGIQGIPLALDQKAADAKNPKLWDAVWLHFEGATYGLDNIEVGTDSARALGYGKGCGKPALEFRGSTRPVLGSNPGAVTHSIPSTALAGVLVIGAIRINPGLSLTSAGAPGCFLNVSPSVQLGFTVTGSTATHTLRLPNNPWLAKQSVHLQSAVADPKANVLGLISSNGLTWMLDVR